MNLEAIQDALKKFSRDNDLVNDAYEHCRQAIRNGIQNDKENNTSKLDGFDPAELIHRFKTQALIFNSSHRTIPFVRTQIGIYVADPDGPWGDHMRPVGRYELDTDLNGEHIDDWLVFD